MSRGSQSSLSVGSCRSAGTAEYVIEIGQVWPASTCDQMIIFAARVTCASGRSSAQGAACRPRSIATVMSQWYAGW